VISATGNSNLTSGDIISTIVNNETLLFETLFEMNKFFKY